MYFLKNQCYNSIPLKREKYVGIFFYFTIPMKMHFTLMYSICIVTMKSLKAHSTKEKNRIFSCLTSKTDLKAEKFQSNNITKGNEYCFSCYLYGLNITCKFAQHSKLLSMCNFLSIVFLYSVRKSSFLLSQAANVNLIVGI